MFGIGLSELLIIGVIALLVVGPDKLPEMAQKLGRFVWDIRRAWDDVRDTVRTEMMGVQQPFDDIRSAGAKAREALKNEITAVKKDTTGSLEQAVHDAKKAAESAATSDVGEKPATTASAPAVGDPVPATAAPEPTETTVSPQAYKPRAATGPAITYFDLDGNPVPPPEKS